MVVYASLHPPGSQPPPEREIAGGGMAGMAGTVRVKRQSCNSAKMSSIMYISLSAGRFGAAWELSLVVVVMRSGRRERESYLGTEPLDALLIK